MLDATEIMIEITGVFSLLICLVFVNIMAAYRAEKQRKEIIHQLDKIYMEIG